MQEKISLTLPLHKFAGALWSYHVSVPMRAVEKLSRDGKMRVLCRVNGSEPLHLALMHDGQGGHFLMFNRKFVSSLQLELGQVLEIELEKDNSKYGMPMPEEFQECLYQDPEAAEYFEALTAGKKRSLLHMVNKLKSSDIRIRKALVILQHLKLNKGILDYKMLNEAFKRANQDPGSVFM